MSGDHGDTNQREGPGGGPPTDKSSYAPLFRIDPGWPFVIAGLALIVSAVLIPAQRELHDLEQQLKVHQAYEEKAKAELVAYEQFLADVQRGDQRLLERLVRAQLNKMPKDERPLLLMPTANDTVPQWIESSVTVEIPEPAPYPDTLLSRIASGPRRLWVLASGTFLVFMGILFVPSSGPRRPLRRMAVAPAVIAPAAAAPGTVALEESVVEESVVEESVVEESVVEESVVEESVTDPVPEGEPLRVLAIEAAGSIDEPPAGEPETLDSALESSTTFEATDVRELQYGDEPVVGEISAATEDLAHERPEIVDEFVDAIEATAGEAADGGAEVAICEIETFSSVPGLATTAPASDRALDALSLFSGIDDSRWLDTREQRS